MSIAELPIKSTSPMKNKSSKAAHTSKSKKGMGDYYGQGVRAPLGKMRSDSMGMIVQTPKKLKKPPKTLA